MNIPPELLIEHSPKSVKLVSSAGTQAVIFDKREIIAVRDAFRYNVVGNMGGTAGLARPKRGGSFFYGGPLGIKRRKLPMVDHEQSFEVLPKGLDFPKLEEIVLQRWEKNDTFHQVDKVRSENQLFVFYEGPPTANASPGIHHVISRAFKDVIIRYKTMQGFRPIRRGGWDTHGLPVELEIEKELGLSSKRDIEKFGIEEFNRRCRESVLRYVQEWEKMTLRTGVWLDMADAYRTYDNSYIETSWWILKTLWNKGLVYEGFRVTPHCPRCVTSLSSHEVALGYQENTPDPSIYVLFKLHDKQDISDSSLANVLTRMGYDSSTQQWLMGAPSFLAWTTTPWTLTANEALAIAPDKEYALVVHPIDSIPNRLILAKDLVNATLGDNYETVDHFKGEELVGVTYEAPFSNTELQSHNFKVLPASYVSIAEGTGIVHTAPAYGNDDYELGRAFCLPTVHTVDLHGTVVGSFPGEGKFVKEADEDLINDLKTRGLLYKREVIKHTYPFCWRCQTPLLYYAKSSWYIKTTDVKNQMVEGNQTINWFPEHIKNGRFGEWLRNNVDWAISRERYWGTPLPFWKCTSCHDIQCIGSIAELRHAAMVTTEGFKYWREHDMDLHRPYVDGVTIKCEMCAGTMHRVPEVADAWYDSGAMPFAQWKYPVTLMGKGGQNLTINNPEELIASEFFPADYITEAVDQTRGWFYSLLALSTLLTGKPSYKNVICLGLILDEKGEKMSKSKGNAVNPWEILEQQGADALRWYLFTSAPAGAARRFSGSLVQETIRQFMLTFWNTVSFFITYANLDNFNPASYAQFWEGEIGSPQLTSKPRNKLDQWITSELNNLVGIVTSEFDAYNPTDAARRIEEFVSILSNWYIRQSRRRFWKSTSDDDKIWAYVTLYSTLVTVSKLIAPLCPFISDEIYRILSRVTLKNADPSVHLTLFPKSNPLLIDHKLDAATRLAMRVASLGRSARSKAKVKVRQPLSKLLVEITKPEDVEYLLIVQDQILEELNIKVLETVQPGELAVYQVKPNYATLGPRYGARINEITSSIEQVDPSAIISQMSSGKPIEVGNFTLASEDLKLIMAESPNQVKASEGVGGLTVAIETTLSNDLREEGLARELVHRIQNLRREAGLEISDRIVTFLHDPSGNLEGLLKYNFQYIGQETLSLELRFDEPPEDAFQQDQTVDGIQMKLAILMQPEP